MAGLGLLAFLNIADEVAEGDTRALDFQILQALRVIIAGRALILITLIFAGSFAPLAITPSF